MTFTKTYNAEPNTKQKASMTRAFKMLTQGFLAQGSNVEVTVSAFENKIISSLIVDGKIFESRIIGENGGLTVV